MLANNYEGGVIMDGNWPEIDPSELRSFRAAVQERDRLRYEYLQIACALGIVYEADGAITNAGPIDAVLDRVRELKAFKGEHRETVICAAIRLPNGTVFRGHRHGDCIRTAHASVTWNGSVDPGEHHWTPDMCSDQGFITSRNRYVGRATGLQLQLAAGIESASADGRGYRGQLYSEDLY